MRRTIRLLLAIILAAATGGAARATDDVDLLLVLTADVSRSLDEGKFRLQRDGYAAAFMDSRVINAAISGPNGRIAVAFIEWAGY